MKYKWKVSPAPTGRYSSFEKRSWPTAVYEDERICARITCDRDYSFSRAKSGDHPPLVLSIADYSQPSNVENNTGFTWVQSNSGKSIGTLIEAKKVLKEILIRNPHLKPDTK